MRQLRSHQLTSAGSAPTGRRAARIFWLCAAGLLWAAGARAQPEDSLIAVSADIVQISGSTDRELGFAWGPLQTGIIYAEKSIPGLIKVGDFARQTALQTTLKLLESEGRAQLLANPKVIVQSGNQANFDVGSKIPFPVCNLQGCTAELKDVETKLNIIPVINPNKKDTVRAEFQLEAIDADFTKAITIGGSQLPTLNSRGVQTTVELKSGETLVIGGFKSSSKTSSTARVPFLGRLPIIGHLFTSSSTIETQVSLFLFITVEVIK